VVGETRQEWCARPCRSAGATAKRRPKDETRGSSNSTSKGKNFFKKEKKNIAGKTPTAFAVELILRRHRRKAYRVGVQSGEVRAVSSRRTGVSVRRCPRCDSSR
jgi:hypothetical protein